MPWLDGERNARGVIGHDVRAFADRRGGLHLGVEGHAPVERGRLDFDLVPAFSLLKSSISDFMRTPSPPPRKSHQTTFSCACATVVTCHQRRCRERFRHNALHHLILPVPVIFRLLRDVASAPNSSKRRRGRVCRTECRACPHGELGMAADRKPLCSACPPHASFLPARRNCLIPRFAFFRRAACSFTCRRYICLTVWSTNLMICIIVLRYNRPDAFWVIAASDAHAHHVIRPWRQDCP